MSFSIHTGSEEFIRAIPEILGNTASMGELTVERSDSKSNDPDSFTYKVNRALGRVIIFCNKDGGLRNIMIVYGSMNPLRWLSSKKLIAEATNALLAGGMVEAEEFYGE